MQKQILALLLFLSTTAMTVYSQDFSPKKGSLIGFSANVTDFSQPLSAKNSFKNENMNPAGSHLPDMAKPNQLQAIKLQKAKHRTEEWD